MEFYCTHQLGRWSCEHATAEYVRPDVDNQGTGQGGSHESPAESSQGTNYELN